MGFKVSTIKHWEFEDGTVQIRVLFLQPYHLEFYNIFVERNLA